MKQRISKILKLASAACILGMGMVTLAGCGTQGDSTENMTEVTANKESELRETESSANTENSANTESSAGEMVPWNSQYPEIQIESELVCNYGWQYSVDEIKKK